MIDHQQIENSIAEKAKMDAKFAHAYAILRLSIELKSYNDIMQRAHSPEPFSQAFGHFFSGQISDHISDSGPNQEDYGLLRKILNIPDAE